ncbi:hypothetical protein MSAN_01719200 [Mycena sanguinolenta]|uniref:Uncharacterized protein n=1 Tax=Mycena sanguinolenta TaxID=230812 RepID=A0A8H6XZU5_9AGAR|nr:hypothetical protein MSAN_01719200 [Mycena sanguinolenta]
MSLHRVLRTSLRHPSPSPAFLPETSRSLNTLRPPTWTTRIWFRPNGTPRRFVLGLVFTSLLSGTFYTRWTIHRDLHHLGIMQDHVSSLVRIQCVDSAEYARVNFSSYKDALNYFDHLFVFCKHIQALKSVDIVLAGSLLEHTQKQDEAHAIMRDAAESVHKLIAEGRHEPHPAKTGRRVMVALLDAAQDLIRLGMDLDRIDPADKIKLQDVQMAVEGVETKNHEMLG